MMYRKSWLTIILFISIFHLASAQSASDWSGNFEGNILGAAATLIGNLDGQHWTGTIAVAGYPIQFDGTVIDMKCTGTMTDPQSKTSSPFVARYAGRQITINIHDLNPISGLEEDMEFIFLKTSAEQVTGTAIASSINQVDKGELAMRDQSLVGLWRYTDSYVSGEYSFATDYFIQLNRDGTALYTDGRTAGGGPASSIVSGQPDTHQVYWKTENKILYAKEENGQWGAYARYYVEGNSMMLTYNNGKKQVWERIR
jgi:hypothetical protein